MELVVDFLLLAASGAAGLYCWVLSKKLKALSDAEAGLGAGVAALSRSAEEMKHAVAETKASADETAARIETLLEQAEDRAAHVQGLIDQLSEMSVTVSDHAENATKKYLETLEPFLEEANEAANRLLSAIAQAPDTAPLEKPVTRQTVREALAGSDVERAGKAPTEYFVIDEAESDSETHQRKTGAAA